MLIFVSGHYPIYGTQILYFADPILAQRAAAPPPTQFVAIDEGQVTTQREFDRTPNVLSHAETLDDMVESDDSLTRPMSRMERAFLVELGRTQRLTRQFRKS
jgi:type IV secretion system protein VirD4